MFNDVLGKRMKDNYESISKTRLVRRMPVVIRIDGKAFHTFTRGFKKPFDQILMNSMQETTVRLCENIQGCVLGYTQSDEISLLLIDYSHLESSAWFDNEVQKICSISASLATFYFNKIFTKKVESHVYAPLEDVYYDTLKKAADTGALFDARCFNVPKEEVTNYFYWRQLDAMRNSVQMVGQAHFSHKVLHGKSCEQIKDMLIDKGVDYDSFSVFAQRGAAVLRYKLDGAGIIHDYDPNSSDRTIWLMDEIPVLKGEGREFIERLLVPEEE